MANIREIVFRSNKPSDNPSDPFDETLNSFVNNSPHSNGIPADPQFFLRINKLVDIMPNGSISQSALLAGPPFVFLTIPQAIVGLDHMQTLYKVGYSSNDINDSGLRDTPMAAIIFKYPMGIQFFNNVKNSSSTWQKGIFPTTWDNIFQIFENLAREANVDASKVSKDSEDKGKYMSMSRNDLNLIFRSERDKNFVCSYPEWGKGRLAGEAYQTISQGGSDWYYRTLLKDGLEITELFSGKGKTSCEVAHLGTAPEYIGPNYSIQVLSSQAEMAIVKL